MIFVCKYLLFITVLFGLMYQSINTEIQSRIERKCTIKMPSKWLNSVLFLFFFWQRSAIKGVFPRYIFTNFLEKVCTSNKT